jgi:hypothetical protein
VVADIAKLSVGREEYYTRELATDHEQYLSGHGESPGRCPGRYRRIRKLERTYSLSPLPSHSFSLSSCWSSSWSLSCGRA